jgi:hypothetical protein
VATFFRIDAGHNCQVYRFSEGDKICIALIFNLQYLLFLSLFVVFAIITIVLVAFLITTLPKDFRLRLSIFLFVLLPLWIKFENIQTIFHIDFVIQGNDMGDLIFFLHQV